MAEAALLVLYSRYTLAPFSPHFSMSACPEVVGWVNATSPFAGSNVTP